ARAQEARSAPSRMTSIMIAHFAELDAHNHHAKTFAPVRDDFKSFSRVLGGWPTAEGLHNQGARSASAPSDTS
ncbi:hypothetical protein NKI32_30570, partial [Mesorhizobium sp. M0761]|uniref:hypothetical protein n=1 Tax=Mesorhizobium sp. M0761 TaxID=2956994 RepID=UPI003338C2DF